MKSILYIFLGGGLGSVLRFLISTYTQQLWKLNNFPLGTLLVNGIGCFLIGYLSTYLKMENDLKFLLITGFCGAFTTFSTFSFEAYHLYQSGHLLMTIVYIISSIILGLLAVWTGLSMLR